MSEAGVSLSRLADNLTPDRESRMTEKLYQLPTGSWVTPSRVTYIHPHSIEESDYTCASQVGHYVVVWQGGHHTDVLKFDTREDADAFADNLARMVNDSRLT